MFELSLRTFRERWTLFVGAMVTVTLGVALVQSSLLILISAASPVLPPGLSEGQAAQLRTGYIAAITLLAMVLAIAAFLAVFIVSSTFAFTVAQRRRDLALLRLVGGSRGQLRRLLLSEALLLGLAGTALGVPLGLMVQRVQSALLTSLGFLPDSFAPRWQGWIPAVSFGIGIGVAVLGVLAASRRAAKVRPLEGLRDLGQAARVMTLPRWLAGLLFLAGSIALVIVSRFVPPSGAVPISLGVSLAAAVGLSALSPLIVPLVGRVFGMLLRPSTLGGLAQANLTDGVRRSASTAAPLLVLVALVLGISGTMSTISGAANGEMARDLAADLVVQSGSPLPEHVSGVAVVSTETPVPITVTFDKSSDTKAKQKTKDVQALAVDPADYRQLHRLAPDSIADLHGMTMAASSGKGIPAGATVTARIGGRELALRVVATLPESASGKSTVLLPRELAPPGPARTFVRLAPGADADTVASAYRAAGASQVMTAAEWIAAASSKQEETSAGIMAVLMGLAGLYTVIAVINAVVIAGAERKAEFAAARATGLRRRQVVLMVLLESCAVAAIGLLFGCLAAVGTLTGIGSAMSRLAGTTVFTVPWLPLALVAAGAFVTVGVTSVLTTLSATRTAPVHLLGARE
ncbi:FtsX-like permease family protein [Amycolatopsis taiwanensis]|uniref:FtsX-like permease family protein n=1 Tax=Amycolatopsis taiwanensis TaxID=342230 RepID=UPI0004AC6CBD|nr:ABC transporter permease [Amycolatopsis taiwanensis]